MPEVVIFGAGGLGTLTLDILLRAGEHRPVGFLDSDASKHGTRLDGLPVFGGIEQVPLLLERSVSSAIVAVGSNMDRVALARRLRELGMTLVSAIHPLASIAPSAQLGAHLIIGARAIICVHAVVESDTVVSAGAIVDHDNRLGEGVFLHPAVRLAGGVTVEELGTVGIGASVIPGRRVGRSGRVSPGAVVIRDVLPGAVVSGVPATTDPSDGRRFVPDREVGAESSPTTARAH